MTLYRAISTAECRDYNTHQQFRTARNTLEAKQFFKSEKGVREFAMDAKSQHYRPAYTFLLKIDVNENCLSYITYDEQEIDGFMAITVFEADLPAFSNCVNFVDQDVI